MKQLEIIYEWLYLKHKNINDENAKYNKDKFWKLLANMIIKYNINFFNKHNVRFLQKKIQLKNISVK
jgi:hypothetical protein